MNALSARALAVGANGRRFAALGIIPVVAVLGMARAAEIPAGSRILYETGFEPFEGFNAENDLAGQNSWIGYATDLAGKSVALGGNGLLPGPTDGFFGQVAYIGFNAPAVTADFNVWRPINLAPAGGVLPVVQFTVSLQIEASSEGLVPDAFRWSVYNASEQRLFSLDFDNATGDSRNGGYTDIPATAIFVL